MSEKPKTEPCTFFVEQVKNGYILLEFEENSYFITQDQAQKLGEILLVMASKVAFKDIGKQMEVTKG